MAACHAVDISQLLIAALQATAFGRTVEFSRLIANCHVSNRLQAEMAAPQEYLKRKIKCFGAFHGHSQCHQNALRLHCDIVNVHLSNFVHLCPSG
jgi:hypothetical protein